jgi:hypothetical protein
MMFSKNTQHEYYFVGAGSLLTSNVQSMDGKLPGNNKPALATQRQTTIVNPQKTHTSNNAKRAGFNYIANQGVKGLNCQSANEPAPAVVGAITSRFVNLLLLGGHDA